MCFRVINNGKNQCLFTTPKLGRRSKLGSSTVPNFDRGYNFEHRKVSVFNLPYVQLANMYR